MIQTVHLDGTNPRNDDNAEARNARLGMNGEAAKTTARAQELRVAALLVREEATAVGHKEHEPPRKKVAENLSPEAQG